MSELICILCSKEFSSNQRLKYHVEKKVCQKNIHKCQQCGHIFNRKTHLQYHIEHNVCHKKTKIVLKKQNFSTDAYSSYTKEELITQLQLKEKENIKLSTEVRVLKENPQTVNNNINLLVNFGQENIDEILAKLPNLLQDTLTKHLGQSIPYLTKQIHCNQELFPEYNNVYIESYRNPFAMIFQNGQFCRQSKMQTIDQLIDQCVMFLGNHVEANIEDQRLIKKYEQYRDSVDTDGHRRKELEGELIGILLDQGDRLKLDNNSRLMLKNYINKK